MKIIHEDDRHKLSFTYTFLIILSLLTFRKSVRIERAKAKYHNKESRLDATYQNAMEKTMEAPFNMPKYLCFCFYRTFIFLSYRHVAFVWYLRTGSMTTAPQLKEQNKGGNYGEK